MEKYIYDENNGLWYELQGDYYIPCLKLPDEEQVEIGVWGQRHLEYIKHHRKGFYIGNPPYLAASTNPYDISAYKTETDGVTDFGERKHWLNDDYVKFFRFSEQIIDKNKEGVLAFVSNNGYLDNPTFRGMRGSLLRTFDKIYIVNLHGSANKKETAPDGSKDENIFDSV